MFSQLDDQQMYFNVILFFKTLLMKLNIRQHLEVVMHCLT